VQLVLDLETLGTGDDAAVVSIGAAFVGGPSAVWRVLPFEAMSHGTTTQSTLDWWAKQCPEAREELTGTLSTQQAVTGLKEWALANGFGRQSTIWGKGPSFDCVLLKNAMARAGVAAFWQFWQERCVRTILQMVPEANSLQFEGTPHRAEDDARHEARQVQMALSKFGVL
jgi:hypothetical protein